MKLHSQWVLFRFILFEELQEIDQTPKWKYSILPEMESHVPFNIVNGNFPQKNWVVTL